MSDNSESTGQNENEGEQVISLETILGEMPGKPMPSNYHTEGIDPSNVEKKGQKLED